MLIRWVRESDLAAWSALADAVSDLFGHHGQMGQDPDFRAFAKRKAEQYEALTAVDYRSGQCMGFLSFSRQNNRISWFAVDELFRRCGVGTRLLKTALRQLDTERPITVTTFTASTPGGLNARQLYRRFGFTEETAVIFDGQPRAMLIRPGDNTQRGNSFHFRYPDYLRSADAQTCPVCKTLPASAEQSDIYENDLVWVCGEYPGQGRLFGKLYVMPKKHYVHFEDIPSDEVGTFICEVQRVGRILRQVTGAEKINYETHANSGAHLHIHLFPRYLDDDFPSAPIDFRVKEPAPYEDYDEFLWFADQMRQALSADDPSRSSAAESMHTTGIQTS